MFSSNANLVDPLSFVATVGLLTTWWSLILLIQSGRLKFGHVVDDGRGIQGLEPLAFAGFVSVRDRICPDGLCCLDVAD